jgi:integrase
MNRIVKCTKNGRAAFRIEVVGADGRRHQLYRATQEAAEDALAKETIASRVPTRCDLPATTTLAQYVERWHVVAARNLKPRSIVTYRATLAQHLLPALGARRIRDLARGDLKALLSAKKDTHKPNTVKLMLAAIRVVLTAAIDDGLITANVAAGLGRSLKLGVRAKARSEAIKALDRRQRDLLLATAARVTTAQHARLWEVHALAGLRPGELYALEPGDLDLDAATARISRTLADDGDVTGTPKGNRERTIDLSTRAVALLRAQLAAAKADKLRHGWPALPATVFYAPDGSALDPRAVRDAFARTVKAAGLSRTFTPHSLRHTFASLLLVAGVDVYYVSRMLGHSTIAETVDTYGRWLPANRKGTLDVLDAPAVTTCDQNA